LDYLFNAGINWFSNLKGKIMKDYQGRKVVIVGLGATGLSCVNFFISKGVTPKVIDSRLAPPGANQLPADIEHHFGSFAFNLLSAADLLVVSPGISLQTPELLKSAQLGIEIIGDIELFCREITAPIIAITGSNGKSTVTQMVGEMAQTAGLKTVIAGNIGQPVLTTLGQDVQLYVLELSSFQLETTYSLSPLVATVLNVSEDHMDRYPGGLESYRAAKLRIYQQAKVCLVNGDDAMTLPVNSEAKLVSFADNFGDYHLHDAQGQTWLKAGGERVLNQAELQITGRHNLLNALAALALADAAGINRASSLLALSRFRGLPHRFQLVHRRHGVTWINDSKATNVGSTLAALKGLSVSGKLWLLLGGQGKSADFTPLGQALAVRNVTIVSFGADAKCLSLLLPHTSQITETLAQAMHSIALQVQPGDCVLLSPACASLDQFRNFEHRGEQFCQLAEELG
jgi:UDP-N-acetylmuramoylalanine--D-glutamate ligase